MLSPAMVELMLTLRDYQPARFYEIGAVARQTLGAMASPCQAAQWWGDWVDAGMAPVLHDRLQKARTDDGKPAQRRFNAMEAALVDLVAKTMAGAMFNAVAIRINAGGIDALEKMVEALDDIAAEGAGPARKAIEGEIGDVQAMLGPVVGKKPAPTSG